MLSTTVPSTLEVSHQYNGYPLLYPIEEFYLAYLAGLNRALLNALNEYPRVFAFRVDLRLPLQRQPPFSPGNAVVNRFFESFREKIKHNRKLARRHHPYAHDSSVRHAWAREIGQAGHCHFHVVIFLNYDAFFRIGCYEIGRPNLFNLITEAWASALGLPVEETQGLATFPSNPSYLIRREDRTSQEAFFRRASYLCKRATKDVGQGHHAFGSSRR